MDASQCSALSKKANNLELSLFGNEIKQQNGHWMCS